MANPLVSVIIPCYNYASYLREAVDSILHCGYDNVEIIVVNDGSTQPEDIEILRNFSAPKTRVIHQKNTRLPGARNTGITASSGKYILPLDADDRIAEGFLTEAVRIAEADPTVCIVSGRIHLFGHKKEGDQEYPIHDRYESLRSELRGNCFTVSSLFRRSDWEKVGGYASEMCYGLEDWDFWISLLEITNGRVVQTEHLSLHYRQHNHSMLRSLTESCQRKNAMLSMLIRRHLDSYLANPDVLGELIFNNYLNANGGELLPESTLKFKRKYRRYQKLTRLMIWISAILLLSLITVIIMK